MPYQVCSVCGKTFQTFPSRPKQRCSRECWKADIRANPEKRRGIYAPCANCGKEVYREQSKARGSRNFYCNYACEGEARARDKGPSFRGGRRKAPGGYVAVSSLHVPDAYKVMMRDRNKSGRGGSVLEHRLIMAIHLGRPLEEWEVVHHKNGDKTDNRVENLEVLGNKEHAGISVVEHKRIVEAQKHIESLAYDLMVALDEQSLMKEVMRLQDQLISQLQQQLGKYEPTPEPGS